MPVPLDVVMVGAGNRGFLAYGPFAVRHPQQVRFVAVAEPDEGRRARFAETHGIPPDRRFRSWEDIASRPPLATAAINATMDGAHHPSTLALLQAGYNLLLEKPMATSPEQCVELVRAGRETGRILQICHVMRYAPFFSAVHDIVRGGRLGDVVSLDWRENLAYSHYAHSYIRGRWGNSARSAPMILTKCCHDLDQLIWVLGRAPRRVASFGALRHFRPEAAPSGVPERCTDGCPVADQCQYYAPRVYLDPDCAAYQLDSVSIDHSEAAILEGLRSGPYGRCVYHAGNDVVENQVVVLDYDDGLAASLTMQGASHEEGRTLRIDGTHATLLGNQARNELLLIDHLTGTTETMYPEVPSSGHGGGDEGVMGSFVAALLGDESRVLTSASESLESHLLAFAAEDARRSRRVIDMDAYKDELGIARPEVA